MSDKMLGVENRASISKPLTYEQIWGVTEPEPEPETKDDFCPYKEKKCDCWDQGCQAGDCVQDMREK